VKVVTGQLKITRLQLAKARKEAEKLNDEASQKVKRSTLRCIPNWHQGSSDDVKTVDTKVVGVRTDVDTTREDLKMARGDGTLIARTHEEIDQLRHLGERDYTEFTITQNARRSRQRHYRTAER